MSIVEIVIVAILAFAVFFALRRVVRMRKSGCCCGCSGCSGGCAACGGACEKARERQPRQDGRPS